MEKDWKADLLLVQKLMGPQRIGRKRQKTWQKTKTYSVHFSRKIKTQNKEKEENKRKKGNKWLKHCALWKTGRTLSLSINKPKISKKNKPKIFIQLKTKEKKRMMTPPKMETRRKIPT